MKTLLIAVSLLFVLNSQASIEHDAKQVEATPQEIATSRSCFDELAQQGCRDSGEDHKEFRACLHNVFPSLTSDCQKMMSRLYGNK
jgi:hypothetical protein